MSGILLAHKGAVVVTRAELEGIEAPEGTETWKPVKHATLVSALTEAITNHQRYIVKEEFAIQRDGKVLFGVMDLKWGETIEYRAALGLRTSNDKTMSIQMVAGARVFVCDNLVFSGDSIVAFAPGTPTFSVRVRGGTRESRLPNGGSTIWPGPVFS